MEDQNISTMGMGNYGASVLSPKSDDVRSGSIVVHDGSRLQHGITSVETVSTYRSDLGDEHLTGVNERSIKAVGSSGNGNGTVMLRNGNRQSSYAPVDINNQPGCKYTKAIAVGEVHPYVVPEVSTSLSGNNVDTKKGLGVINMDHLKNTEVGDLMSETRDALASTTLRSKDSVLRGSFDNYPYIDRERGVFRPPIYTRNGLAPSYRVPYGKVFKKNRYDKETMRMGNTDVDMGLSDVYSLRDASGMGNSTSTIITQRAAGYFWHRPFGTSHRDKGVFFRGLPYVETVNPGMQKSWHLEAISSLTREQYASLKMIMLRLSRGTTNIDPKRLLMLSRGNWEVLQEGTFGTVYIGCVEGMGNCAVKIPVSIMVQQDPVGVMRRYINEWDILSRCDHPNIVKLCGGLIFGVFDIWLCTELIKGADLHSIKYSQQYKRVITPTASLRMCRQLADAILYLHTPTAERDKVVHRDIKPENIIVMPDWSIKLCDFGDAWENAGCQVDHISGATWLYAPPELLKHKCIMVDIVGMDTGEEGDLTELSEKWDIWSMGCVFQEMFGYSGPFHHLVDVQDEPTQICEKMVKNAIKGLVPQIPHPLAATKMGQLIAQCLQNDAKLRPTAAQVCAVLQATDAFLLH
ncbi:serine threonine kinase [Babesia ovis]|uniref:Serine threonine kinase n=1 Tax=Babesia ovis TaxID=5869 RepID=A0A9W5TCN3_BABOV|nr:serine threonine kinase [Babesia ovis]